MLEISKGKKILITVSILIVAVTAVTALNITNSNPDGYKLAVETASPTDVTQTQATFHANVTELDPIYDAALVYWNYTDGTTEYKGPANLTLNPDTEVSGRQTGLSGATGYDIEAYAEPVIWEDQKLMSNMVDEEGAMSEVASSSTAMTQVSSSSIAMTQVISSSTAMNEILSSEIAKNEVFSKNIDSGVQVSEVDFTPSDHVFIRTKSANDPYDFSASTSVDLATNVDFTGKDTLKIDWIIRSQKTLDYHEDRARIFVGGSKVFDVEGVTEDTTRSIDVSGITGRQNIKVQAYIYDHYSNYYSEQEIEIYNMWLE